MVIELDYSWCFAGLLVRWTCWVCKGVLKGVLVVLVIIGWFVRGDLVFCWFAASGWELRRGFDGSGGVESFV